MHRGKRLMRFLEAGLLLIVAVSPSLAQSKPPSETMKVKVEGTELDQRQLLQKMNEHGADHKMRFEASAGEFDYRIVFETSQGQDALQGTNGFSHARVRVFDAKGTELFNFDRGGRLTDSGATNAAAKEVIKRILK